MKIELTPNEVQVLTGVLGGYLRDTEDDEEFKDSHKTIRSVFTKLLDEGCPDVLCEDCVKEDCNIRKLGLVPTKEIEK